MAKPTMARPTMAKQALTCQGHTTADHFTCVQSADNGSVDAGNSTGFIDSMLLACSADMNPNHSFQENLKGHHREWTTFLSRDNCKNYI